jgi:hypothetical protein
LPANWIWVDEVRSGADAPPEQRAFRKSFMIEGTSLVRGRLDLTADAGFTVWINGDRVGQGEFLPQVRRMQSIDVTRHLKPGRNVIAVEGTIKKGIAGVLARLTYSCRDAASATVVSDVSWRAHRSLPDGWQSPIFDDSDWSAAKIVCAPGKEPAEWRHLIWDGMVDDRYSGAAARMFPDPTGNVRDWNSEENFPPFRAVPLNFELTTDVRDDAHFLRYGRASLLTLAGSPGVAPAEKSSEKQ